MRRSTLFLSIALVIAVCCAVVAASSSNDPSNPKSERREVRENRRAQRQATMEREIDSIVMAKAFIFSPQTAQQEPAGKYMMLSNPNFEVRVWDNSADVFIPYMMGATPPYRSVLLNCTISGLNEYTTVQTDDGWLISFDSNLYSSSSFKFKLEVNAKFGTATLTVSNIWNTTMTYGGMLSKIY